MNLKTGDLVFINSGSMFSKIVKWVTGFEYGHVALAIDSNRLMDIKAFKPSTIEELSDLTIKNYTVQRCTEKFDENKMKMIAYSCVGIKYDYPSILRLLMKYRLGMKTRRTSYDIKTLYCSEFVDYVYSQLGIDLLLGESSLISIEDLYYSEKMEVIENG